MPVSVKQDQLLQTARARLKALMGDTTQAYILLNKDCSIGIYNKKARMLVQKIAGTKLTEGIDFRQLLARKGMELLLPGFKTAVKGKAKSAEIKINAVNGKQYSVICSYNPVLSKSGKPECIALTMQDISECKYPEPDLHKSGKLMDAVFHTAEIGIALVNSKGIFVKVNDGLCKLTGYKQAQLIGKPYLIFSPASEKKEILQLQQQLLSGTTGANEQKVVCLNKSQIDCHITNNLITDDDGNRFLVKTFRDITESKKYKNLLQGAERAVQMGGYEFDTVRKHLMWTSEMYRLFEVEKGFIPGIGKLIHLFTPESRKMMHRCRQNALLYGKNFDAEVEIVTPAKNRKWLRVTGTPRKEKLRVVKLVGTVQDITQRKEAEMQMQRLSFVASKTNNAVIITDPAGKTEWVNESFIKMTGFQFSDILGKKPGEVLQGTGTDKAAVKRMSVGLRKKKQVTEIIKNYRKDGSPFWINMDITPVFSHGKLLNYIGLGVDITDLVKARESQSLKESLEQQQAMFDAIAKNFPDGIIGVLDDQFKYVFAGGTEIKKLGLTASHLIGEHIFDSISEKNNFESEPYLKRALEGENVSFEEELRGNTYAVTAVPMSMDDKAARQILVVIYNITKRKKAEEEVWQALIKQKQLNELKSKFVSIASHEFRTPLSGILSSAYLISKYIRLPDEEKVQKHTEKIAESVRILTDILNDFLSLGKMEESKIQNNAGNFNLPEFCETLKEELQQSVKKGQLIVYNHKGTGQMLCADKQHLRHVLTNLLSNAIKYSPEGKTIRLTSSNNNGKIQLVVADEGMGIPEADQPHLFQTFFRAHNAVNIQGTGMGLHIVKRYLDIMGGTIKFTSKENLGTIFTITLPENTPD